MQHDHHSERAATPDIARGRPQPRSPIGDRECAFHSAELATTSWARSVREPSGGGSRALRGALIAGVASLIAGGAVLVAQVTADPPPAPVRAAVSPSDLVLGHVLSGEVPVGVADLVGASVPAAPSPADLVLGHVLSGEVPHAGE